MSGPVIISIETSGGWVDFPIAQALALTRVVRAYRDAGAEPEVHRNKCGCCIAVHPPGSHDEGHLIGEDGGVIEVRDGAVEGPL
jgi:hypothetical protein